ncbi:ROK family protein [Negadavirga shengliensis]|uniref:ROK family protein n=1 Tax=Negadavirga shengliensis TaxID=1389218 RepID=A0ABV9T0R5_9BACT
MTFLSVDLGGTSLRLATFTKEGDLISRESFHLEKRQGSEVGKLIRQRVEKQLQDNPDIQAIGASVPGISRKTTQTVWAPNIPGWEDYPLWEEISGVSEGIPVTIDCDRACYILGEYWKGHAKGCNDAIYLSVGTGIGAGILVDGRVLQGAHGIAGSVGWMALDRPFQEKYIPCGCFEYHASGAGLAKVAQEKLATTAGSPGKPSMTAQKIEAGDVFAAYDKGEKWAISTLENAIGYWGMGVANLISIFNPEKIIFGGGVFGPGKRFLEDIATEAKQWAQPVSMKLVSFDVSALGGDAGLYGAGYLASQTLENQNAL